MAKKHQVIEWLPWLPSKSCYINLKFFTKTLGARRIRAKIDDTGAGDVICSNYEKPLTVV